MAVTVTLTVNGVERTVTTDPQRPLLDVLREDLHLTGAKYGCGEGRCGACTVLMDGKPVRSCVTPMSLAGAKSITTIEGLAKGDGGGAAGVVQALQVEGVVTGIGKIESSKCQNGIGAGAWQGTSVYES